MKKFLAKASRSFTLSTSPERTVETAKLPSLIEPGLHLEFSLPPVPHPCPHDHLALLASEGGLLIRPHIPGSPFLNSSLYSYLRLSWGKSNKIEQLEKREEDDLDWTESVIVYGIAGIVELFTCLLFLLIASLSSDQWQVRICW